MGWVTLFWKKWTMISLINYECLFFHRFIDRFNISNIDSHEIISIYTSTQAKQYGFVSLWCDNKKTENHWRWQMVEVAIQTKWNCWEKILGYHDIILSLWSMILLIISGYIFWVLFWISHWAIYKYSSFIDSASLKYLIYYLFSLCVSSSFLLFSLFFSFLSSKWNQMLPNPNQKPMPCWTRG